MSTENRLFWALIGGTLFAALVSVASYLTLQLTGRGDELYAWAVLMVIIHGPVLIVTGTVGTFSILAWRASRRLAWAALALSMLAVAATSITMLH